MLRYDDDGTLDPTSMIPMVDGGTEGFKGNLRVIIPGMTACLECSMDLYPPAVNFPMCTIAHTPRLPEHCVEYVKVVMWPKMEPFGSGVAVDGDDPQHVQWITSRAEERAKEYGIQGVTYRLTLGVVKNIIPAVASTNAIVAALCATEVLKLASYMYPTLDNFLLFNDTDGIYSSSFQIQRNENCLACSRNIQKVEVKSSDTLQDLIDILKDHPTYQMRSPGITTTIDGKKKTLYIPNIPALEVATRENLEKSLKSLGLTDEQQIIVADATSPDARVFVLKFM
ncbi:hypothetical protein RvY_04824 [Ramazzottius varieornatus]|uniref:NEDD8-activating enzyme E1 catalytic subunit n=1 Tax=Ramazzottius varieornatus TaxID=947166 RepID=A0A1D1USY0_RAMVA|nr:hypothetical protein RvY_04824 [Ramazzottius varieornatus]